jgi:hypothetical protein
MQSTPENKLNETSSTPCLSSAFGFSFENQLNAWCQRYQICVATVFKPLRNKAIIERFWRAFFTKNHDKNPRINSKKIR